MLFYKNRSTVFFRCLLVLTAVFISGQIAVAENAVNAVGYDAIILDERQLVGARGRDVSVGTAKLDAERYPQLEDEDFVVIQLHQGSSNNYLYSQAGIYTAGENDVRWASNINKVSIPLGDNDTVEPEGDRLDLAVNDEGIVIAAHRNWNSTASASIQHRGYMGIQIGRINLEGNLPGDAKIKWTGIVETTEGIEDASDWRRRSKSVAIDGDNNILMLDIEDTDAADKPTYYSLGRIEFNEDDEPVGIIWDKLHEPVPGSVGAREALTSG